MFLKNKLKTYFPNLFRVLAGVKHFIRCKRMIENVFKTQNGKHALLSYVTSPFLSENNYSHTNYVECRLIAEELAVLGYDVDVVEYSYTGDLDFKKYSLLIGFGDAFNRYFESNANNLKTIYYGAGMHVGFQNESTLRRLKDVYLKKKEWICSSIRFVEKTWTYQTSLVDGMVVVGNEICSNSYRLNYSGPIFNIFPPAYCFAKSEEVHVKKGNSGKHFIWFGGGGVIHKGLDLVLDVFSAREDIHLHVCGPIDTEVDFHRVYSSELFSKKNITTHGFININSREAMDIFSQCDFLIYPSCSEGGSPNIANVLINSSMIPIITKETSFSSGKEILINGFTPESVSAAIDTALVLSKEELSMRKIQNYQYVKENYNLLKYKETMSKAISSISDSCKGAE